MITVIVTASSLLVMFAIWIHRIGKIVHKQHIFKNIFLMAIDVSIFMLLINYFGLTNFAIQTSALINVMTSILLMPLLKLNKII